MHALVWSLIFGFGTICFAQDATFGDAIAQTPRMSDNEDNSESMECEPPRMHPANGALRFTLELAALTAMGAWGLDQTDGVAGYSLMIGVPVVAAGAWGTFAVPNDPSRGGKGLVRVPGLARLGVELAFFGFATWAMADMGHADLARGYAATTGVHYAISFKRIRWLLRQ